MPCRLGHGGIYKLESNGQPFTSQQQEIKLFWRGYILAFVCHNVEKRDLTSDFPATFSPAMPCVNCFDYHPSAKGGDMYVFIIEGLSFI